MAKGKPRDVTAASVILRQAETPEPVNEPVRLEIRRADPDDQERESAIQVHTTYNDKPAYRPATKGVKAGLKQGETRTTCIFRDEQSRVLHDWAKTTGRTFREVCLSMAHLYIEQVVRPATSGDRKLINTGDIPEAYAEMYDEAPDQWAQFFG